MCTLATIDRVDSFKFLGVYISAVVMWSTKTPQRLRLFRKLKQSHLPQHLLINFYRDTFQWWFGSCTVEDRRGLQLDPNYHLAVTYTLASAAGKPAILDTVSGHFLFSPFPSGRKYCTIKTNTNRLINSFFPHAAKGVPPTSAIIALALYYRSLFTDLTPVEHYFIFLFLFRVFRPHCLL